MRTFLIDTDTASDDAIALVMALRWPDVHVAAITVVSGNVPVEQGVRNALYTVELCAARTPVFCGADRPLVREPVYAQFFHGQDGLGDQNYPPPSRGPENGHGVDALIETIISNPGIVLVTLGPLTNVALAIERAPDVVSKVDRCVVMGGAACTVGNVTPAAEYNIWVDPEAARTVFHSGLPIEMVGWELCRGPANLTGEEISTVRQFDTPLAHFAIDCNSTAIHVNQELFGEPGLALPDPVAMGIALDPKLCTKKSKHYVDIETASDLTRGMTVVDELDVADFEHNKPAWDRAMKNEAQATVCWAINIRRWKDMLYQVLRDT